MVANMIGTATIPLMTAAQNSIAMGSILVRHSAAPPSVRRQRLHKTQGALGGQFKAAAQAEGFGDGIGGRSGKNRYGKQAGADNAGGKQREGQRPAMGRNASAACEAVSIFVMPCALSVAAVVTMMKKAIRLENSMPDPGIDGDVP